MADCPPSRIHVGDSIQEVVELLKTEIERAGGRVRPGDESTGFSVPLPIGGSVNGHYSIDGQSLAIQITSRPAAVPCNIIESKMHDYVVEAKSQLNH